MFKRTLAILAVSLAAVGANAAALTPFKGELPAALQFAKRTGALEVYKSFPAVGGLVGWLVQDKSSGKNLIVYTTKGGEALIAGMALNAAGENLTAKYAEEHVPQPDFSQALNEFNAAPSVTVGNPKAKAAITVLFDPNCGYCKIMHKLVDPAIDAGELKVTIVPVAILGGDSDVKAAGILAAKDPRAALKAVTEGHGTIEVSRDKALIAKVMGNNALMKKHGFNGTPGVLYMGGTKATESTVYTANGVPNITDMFGKLGINGQVETLRKDPALARFVR